MYLKVFQQQTNSMSANTLFFFILWVLTNLICLVKSEPIYFGNPILSVNGLVLNQDFSYPSYIWAPKSKYHRVSIQVLFTSDLFKSVQYRSYVHSPSKCLVRFGLYGVKWPQQKQACHSHDDAPPLSFQLQVTEAFF